MPGWDSMTAGMPGGKTPAGKPMPPRPAPKSPPPATDSPAKDRADLEAKAEDAGMDPVEFAREVLAHPDEYDPETVREARLYLKPAPRQKAPSKPARPKGQAAKAPADIPPDDAAFESAMARRAR